MVRTLLERNESNERSIPLKSKENSMVPAKRESKLPLFQYFSGVEEYCVC